jgi:hypothetical protein
MYKIRRKKILLVFYLSYKKTLTAQTFFTHFQFYCSKKENVYQNERCKIKSLHKGSAIYHVNFLSPTYSSDGLKTVAH